MKLEINNKRNPGKSTYIWKLNKTFSEQICQRRHQERNKNYLKTNENGNTTYQITYEAAKIERKLFT